MNEFLWEFSSEQDHFGLHLQELVSIVLGSRQLSLSYLLVCVRVSMVSVFVCVSMVCPCLCVFLWCVCVCMCAGVYGGKRSTLCLSLLLF